MLQSDLSSGPFRKGGQGGFMQLPADFNKMAPCLISAPAPLRKGEIPCLRRTHVKNRIPQRSHRLVFRFCLCVHKKPVADGSAV